MQADRHPSEAARLADLKSFDILDSPRERPYDDIVALAARLCGTHASTITFIDADRQWFKAAIGMPPEPAPLEMAVCAHTIVAGGFLEIPDTLQDPRTSDNPGAQGPNGLRFYAGAQLVTSRGFPIGTLCVLGLTPQRLTDTQRSALQVLADQVVKLLELRVALRTAETLRREVDHRTKNSLQLVASLLSIQRRAAPEPAVRAALTAVHDRVIALSSLHDTMQQSHDGRTVNLRVLVSDLCDLMARALTEHIRFAVDVPKIEVTARVATSLAVIVNEFASNALKHAFAEGQPGTISYTCTRGTDGMVTFTCADNGRGLTGRPDAPKGGMGHVAMQASASQIGATLTVTTPPAGYAITLEFDPSAG